MKGSHMLSYIGDGEKRLGMLRALWGDKGINGVLRYGNGCTAYSDCFSCPFRDCVAETGNSSIIKFSTQHQPIVGEHRV